jgi:hypothetical protein
VNDDSAERRLKVFTETVSQKVNVPFVAHVRASDSVQDRIAWSDATNRKTISLWIMWLFGTVNIITIGFIIWLAVQDQAELAAKIVLPADRVVKMQVVMSLLGATTVQLGTIAVIMTRSIFQAPG